MNPSQDEQMQPEEQTPEDAPSEGDAPAVAQDAASPALFEHTRRAEWGRAVLVWDHGEKRGYQFEDGQLRVLKLGYFHFMREVDLPLDQCLETLARLDQALGRNRVGHHRSDGDVLSFDDQVRIFLTEFPGGFRGEAWTTAFRGGGRPLKRHREPALAEAVRLLGPERLRRLLEADRSDEVPGAILRVVSATSLVRPSRIEPLAAVPEERRALLGQIWAELLHGEGDAAPRFQAVVRLLGEPSWELVTASLTLVHPQKHVCVTPASFQRQARWMAPRLQHSVQPDPAVYLRYLAMAQLVREQLRQSELDPRDLVDVHDFIVETLRPTSRKALDGSGAEAEDGGSDQAAA